MSNILCVIDGMTDPCFHAGDYPNLAAMHFWGKVDTTRGQEPESLGCILRLLGTKSVPERLRGFVEALGYGIPVNPTDLILRGSWFSVDADGCCGVPVSPPVCPEEIKDCRYYHLEQYKSLLVFPGMAHYAAQLVTYPPYACHGRRVGSLCPRGCNPVSRLFQAQLTAEHCLIPWGQSVAAEIPAFPAPAAVVCGTPVVKGIGSLLHMTLMPVTGATGDVDTDLRQKAEAALRAARSYPFVLLHINGADEASHRKNREEKHRFLGKVDEIVLKSLLQSDHSVFVVSDHGTDPVTGQHLAEQQPVFSNKSPEEPKNRLPWL